MALNMFELGLNMIRFISNLYEGVFFYIDIVQLPAHLCWKIM